MLIISIPLHEITDIQDIIDRLNVYTVTIHFDIKSDCILNGNATQEMLDASRRKIKQTNTTV